MSTTETAPAGNRGLDTTSRSKDSVMPFPKSIHLPVVRVNRTQCGDVQPQGWYRCNRPADHTGRHNFSWRHLDGRVRGVWA